MASKTYKTGLIITGDGSGGVKAIRATREQLDKLNSGMRGGSAQAKQFGGSMTGMFSSVSRSAIGVAASVAGVALSIKSLVDGVQKSIKVGEDYERMQLRTEALIKATGSAAGLSSKTLATLASDVALSTLQSVEGVSKAINILQTFRSISGETFKQAISLSGDLATVMGGDITSSATQLGKALEDPVQGINSLRRAGVSFSIQQQELIRNLVETGEKAQAQKIILGELEKQVGGVGASEAKGLSGSYDTLSQRLDELALSFSKATGAGKSWKAFVDGVTKGVENITGFLDENFNIDPSVDAFNKALELQIRIQELEENGSKRSLAQVNRLRLERIEYLKVLGDEVAASAERAKLAASEHEALLERQKALNGVTGTTTELTEEEKKRQQELMINKKLNDQFIESLRIESEELKLNDKERFIQIRLRRLNADATDEELKKVRELSGNLYDESEALKSVDKANKSLEKSAINVINGLDPVGSKIRSLGDDIVTVQNAADKGFIDPDVAQAAIDELTRRIIKAGEDSGNGSSDEYVKSWERAGDRVASTLQNAISTGDWAGIGQTVGGVFAGELANVVTKSLGSSLGLLAPLGGALVGGLVGGLVTGDLFGDVEDPTAKRQAGQGAGSVLGGINEKSASIARSNDLIESSTRELVNINTGMLNALRGLDQSIVGAVSAAARGRSGLDFALPSASTFANGIEGGSRTQLAFSTFGFSELFTAGAKSKQLDEGIQILGGRLTDVIDNTLVEAFATFKVRKNYLDDYDIRERFQSMGDDVNRSFSEAFAGILESVSSGASALGIDSETLSKALSGVVIETQKISLEGLDSAAQQAEIEAVFSKVFDDTVTAAVPYLEEMQRAGEGLGETLARVTTQFDLAKEAQSILGFQVSKTLNDIIDTSFLPFGDALGQAVLPLEFMVKAADDLIAKTGGLEAFSSALSGYEKNFLSEAEQTENLARRLREALGDLGLPETRQGFRDLMEAQDSMTEQGRENIATLLKLQGAADQYYDALESSVESFGATVGSVASNVSGALSGLRSAVSSQISALRDQERILKEGLSSAEGDTNAALDRLRDLAEIERKALEASAQNRINATKSAIKAEADARLNANRIILDAAKAGVSELESELSGVVAALKSLDSDTSGSRADALNTLRSAIATGNFAGVGDAARTAANIDESSFSTRAGLIRAQAEVRGLLGSVQAQGGEKLSDAQKTVAELEAQTSVIRASSDAQIAAAEQRHVSTVGEIQRLLIKAESQINEARGIKDGTLSLGETLAALNEFISVESELRKELEESNFNTEIDRLNSMVANAEMQVDLLQGNNAELKTISGAMTYLAEQIRIEKEATEIPQFASGGSHSGGLAIVGEQGPELVSFSRPAHIFNNRDSKNLLNIGPIVAGLARLERSFERLEAYARQNNKNTGKAANKLEYLERWDVNGMPA